jgi:hypothetical protein
MWLSGGFPVLVAGEINENHADWNSLLITTRGILLRNYAKRHSCFICLPDSPTTAPYTHTQFNSRRSWYSTFQGLCSTGAFDYLICTQLASSSYPHRNHMSIILLKHTGLPRFHANWLRCFPDFPWRQTPWESRDKRQGGNRQVRRGANQRHPRGHSGICSQAPAPCRPTASSARQ